MREDYTDARTRVLQALQAAGAQGLTTWELIHASHHTRAVGRVWEIADHDIEKRHEGGRVYRWIYRGAREPKQAVLWGEIA